MLSLLDTIRQRTHRTKGIALASDYAGAVVSCLGDTACAARFGSGATADQWDACLKEAANKLIYRDEGMAYIGKSAGVITSGGTPGSCLDFDCVITTTRKDRDGDVLESKGAVVDPRHPLLWQHLPLVPIGKHTVVIGQDDSKVTGSFAIADTAQGQDAATLLEFGALRISHGFRPIEFEPLKSQKVQGDPDSPEVGYHVKRFEVLETSLVSVPSNVDAVITAFSRQKLTHPLIKGWAESHFKQRPASVSTAGLEIPVTVKWSIEHTPPTNKAACVCGAKADAPAPEPPPPQCQYEGCKKPAKPGEKFCEEHLPKPVPTTADGPKAYRGKVRVKRYGPFIGLPAFVGSYEWIADRLADQAMALLQAGTTDETFVLATFADHALICLRKGYSCGPCDPCGPPMGDGDFDADDGYRYFRCGWALTGTEPTWAGPAVEVALTAAIQEQAKGIIAMKTKAAKGRKSAEIIAESKELFDETGAHEKTLAPYKVMCKEASGQLAPMCGKTDEEIVDDDPEAPKPPTVQKPEDEKLYQAWLKGRISKGNLKRIKDAHDMAAHMAGADDMHRAGKSMMKNAQSNLKEILDSVTKPDQKPDANPETEPPAVPGKPNEGVDDKAKSADDVASNLIGRLYSGEALSLGVAVSLKEVAEHACEQSAEQVLAGMR